MERAPTAGKDALAYRTDSFSAAIVAAAIMAAGGLLFFAIATVIPRGEPAIAGAVALVGAGGLIGGAAAFIRSLDRSGIILDRAHGQVTTWRRLVVPRSSETRELAAFWTVLLSPGRRQTRYASRTVYLVGLHGEVGEPLRLHWDENYQTARRFAEEVAAFLGFPFTDAAAVQTVVYAGGQASSPPRDVRSAAPPARRAPPPAGMRCRVSWRGTTLVIQEPRVGWGRLIGLPLAVFLLLALPCLGLGGYARFFGAGFAVVTDPLLAAIIVAAMMFAILLAVVVSTLPQLAPRRLVEANPSGLRFRIEGPFAAADRHIKRADIRELRIALGHLIAITPRDYRMIGGTLDQPLARAELEWLRDQLCYALEGSTATD
jgi:hypothetical protein